MFIVHLKAHMFYC